MDLEAMVRELWDRDRIARIPRRYSRGIDRRDWDLVRSCFAADAFVDGSRASRARRRLPRLVAQGRRVLPHHDALHGQPARRGHRRHRLRRDVRGRVPLEAATPRAPTIPRTSSSACATTTRWARRRRLADHPPARRPRLARRRLPVGMSTLDDLRRVADRRLVVPEPGDRRDHDRAAAEHLSPRSRRRCGSRARSGGARARSAKCCMSRRPARSPCSAPTSSCAA